MPSLRSGQAAVAMDAGGPNTRSRWQLALRHGNAVIEHKQRASERSVIIRCVSSLHRRGKRSVVYRRTCTIAPEVCWERQARLLADVLKGSCVPNRGAAGAVPQGEGRCDHLRVDDEHALGLLRIGMPAATCTDPIDAPSNPLAHPTMTTDWPRSCNGDDRQAGETVFG